MIAFFLLSSFALVRQDFPVLPERPPNISSVVVMTDANELGEQLVITGTVYGSDGKTPREGVLFYVYQTDALGSYNKADGSWRHPRIKGWFRSGKDGTYKLRTIKPGSYPGSRTPAHIHVVYVPEKGRARWFDDFLFDGDPHLREEDYARYRKNGNFSSILKLSKGNDGVWRGERNIKVE
jgi:protocatechuate 3,4-dioxygenase beta subunit